jgi:hypothetical protein
LAARIVFRLEVPVLPLSSRDEAVALLGGDEERAPELSVLTSAQAAARGPAVVEPLPAARTTRKRAHESIGEAVGIDIDSDWWVAS